MTNRLGDSAFVVLSTIYYIGVLIADLTIWPGRAPTILLAVPILLAGLWKPPWIVMTVAVIAIGVDSIDFVDEHPNLSLAASSLLALVVISYVAAMLAFYRQNTVERDHRREAMIRTVQDLRQPLTVMVGYIQLLRARPDLPEDIKRSLARIENATRELKRLIYELLCEGAARSA